MYRLKARVKPQWGWTVVYDDVKENSAKGCAITEENNTHLFPLVHQGSHLTVEHYSWVNYDFSRRIFSISFPRNWGEAVWPAVPWIFLPALLEDKSGTFSLPAIGKLSQMPWSLQAVFQWHQPAPSELRGENRQAPWTHIPPLCLSAPWAHCPLLKISPPCSTFLQVSVAWNSWRLVLLVKRALSTPAFAICHQFPCPNSAVGPHFR